MRTVDLLILGASQLVTVAPDAASFGDGSPGPLAGAAMNDLGVIEDGALAIHRGRIAAVGTTNEIQKAYHGKRRIFARGRVVMPGFVDPHTHPVFAKMREDEFALRCRGADYEEILASGGGIHASARALQDAPRAKLLADLLPRLDGFLRHGTTLIEGKSGYGLTKASELRSLSVLRSADRQHPVDIARTFLGAHAVPPDRRRREYIREVIDEMIPVVAERKLAEFCDVFVERGAFTVAEAERILRAGAAHGLRAKVHADQFRDGGGAALAAKMKAISVEHVDATGPAGIHALRKAGTIPVLLPTASVFTGLRHLPNGRRFIDAGLPVALATDFNPGTSPTENQGLVASMACSLLGMTPEEAIVGITRNAAAAIGREDAHGLLARGHRANLVILDAPSYIFLPYRMGTNLVHAVIVRGQVVVRRGRIQNVK